MRIRIETSSLATPHQSGVASYTKLLTANVSTRQDTYCHYFNFLDRQPQPDIAELSTHIEKDTLIPLRVYAKLQSHNFALPFDILLPPVDLTIFPNFATWPTAKSKLTATTIHDLTYIRYPEYVEAGNLHHLRRVVPRSVTKSDIILTVSEAIKREIVEEFHVEPDKIIVTHVPPEDDFKQLRSSKELEVVRTKYSIGDKKYILFLGNFEPRKNLKTLIASYEKLPKKYKDNYRLVLAGGKGWNAHETQDQLDKAIKQGNDIIHIGYVDSNDRAALYQAASVFVLPSHYEGFGIPVLEAQYSGCAVVAADIPALREAGGIAALYADPDSVDDFTRVIQLAIDDYPYSKSQMKKSADRFGWGKNIEAITVKAAKLLGNH